MQTECKHLVVVTPIGDQFEEPAFLQGIQDLLGKAYPEYRFAIVVDSEFRDDSFVLAAASGHCGPRIAANVR
jgi:hypothetical protein